MSTYMQNYLHRRLLRLAGQSDTTTDYYSDQHALSAKGNNHER